MPVSDAEAIRAKILASRLINGQNIHGVGICKSECPLHPDYDNITSLHVYADSRARIPSTIADVAVERIHTSQPIAFVQGGASLSNTFCQCTGTLGAQVFDASNDTPMVLTCAHVACLDQNANYVSPLSNIPIISPGQYDGGTTIDAIAKLTRWARLSASSTALADWAVAQITDTSLVQQGISNVGAISGIKDFVVGDTIESYGRTTGLIQGTVADDNAQVAVGGYGFGTVNYDHQIVSTTAIAGAGDSGALGLNPSNNLAGGLLFSGSTTLTIFNPMSVVANSANIVMNAGDTLPAMPTFASSNGTILTVGILGALALAGYYLL